MSSDRSPRYEVRVAGHLGERWVAWFEDLDVVPEPDGTTVLRGPVADQAALHGLLHKLRDIGIPIVSLHRIGPPPCAGPPDPSPPPHPTPGAPS